VQTVLVNQGDQVERGQVLASLDPEPYEISVTSARSQLQSAEANYINKRADLERQKDLLEKGWVAKAAYDQAVAAYDSAEGDLNLARSRLSSAERDLNNTRLTAPFDGVIASREVEPFIEATPGQALFQINSEGALEVDISIPDTLINLVTLGLPVRVDALNGTDCGCTGRIIEIGSVAGAANAVTVTAALLSWSPDICAVAHWTAT
jgi:RND family efflux transporter MFP subunit